MLDKVKLMLGIVGTDKDALLNALICQCLEEAKSYTHNNTLPCPYEAAVLQMVLFKYNQLGAQGVNSESYSGVSFTYAEDYPEYIYKQLRAHRKVKMA